MLSFEFFVIIVWGGRICGGVDDRWVIVGEIVV